MTAAESQTATPPIVSRNRWRDVFDGTLPEGWEPTLTVSVIIPSFKSKTLEFTLASLAAQDYPEDLLEVAEHRVAASGHASAWLAVVAGNARARRFYERCGWVDTGDLPYEVTAGGLTFVSPCRRYVKDVSRG